MPGVSTRRAGPGPAGPPATTLSDSPLPGLYLKTSAERPSGARSAGVNSPRIRGPFHPFYARWQGRDRAPRGAPARCIPEEDLSVSGDPDRDAPGGPCKNTRRALLCLEVGHVNARAIGGEERASISGEVVEPDRGDTPVDFSRPPIGIDGEQEVLSSLPGHRVPELRIARGPGEAERPARAVAHGAGFPTKVHHHDLAHAVERERMVDECDPVSVRRETWMTGCPGPELDRTNRELECGGVGLLDSRSQLSTWRPVRVRDVLGDLSRCSAQAREASQCPAAVVVCGGFRSSRTASSPVRDTTTTRAFLSPSGCAATLPLGRMKTSYWVAFEGSAECHLPTGHEAGRTYVARAEGDLLELERAHNRWAPFPAFSERRHPPGAR